MNRTVKSKVKTEKCQLKIKKSEIRIKFILKWK